MGLTNSSNKNGNKDDDNRKQIIMVGHQGVGKRALLCQLKYGEINSTLMSTIGFYTKGISLGKGVDLVSWDLGGRCPMRAVWRHYCKNVQGLICVVDSTDVEHITYAASQLERMLEEEILAGCPLLVLANKNDLPGALTADEMTQLMRLTSDNKKLRLQDRPFAVFSICATSFDAATRQAFEWMAAEIKQTEMEVESSEEVALPAAPMGKKAAASGEPGKLVRVAENLLPKGLKRLLFA